MIKTEESAPQPVSSRRPDSSTASAIFESGSVPAAASAVAPKELREFGLLVGGVMALIGLVSLWRGRPAGPYLVGIGAALFVMGAVAPVVLRPIHRVWMALAVRLGNIMTTVILTVLYYLIITPMSFLCRVLGIDTLKMKIDRKATSYWDMRENPKPPEGAHFTNMF